MCIGELTELKYYVAVQIGAIFWTLCTYIEATNDRKTVHEN
jgi:hypothetical protein